MSIDPEKSSLRQESLNLRKSNPMQRVKTTLKFGVALGSGLSAIGGLIGDFLVPIAPFALYLSILGFSFLGLSIMAYMIKPVQAICAEKLGEIWYSPLFWLLFIFSGLTYAAHSVSDASSGNGVLADNIAVVRELQQIVLQLKRIADDSERRTLLEQEERNSAAYRLSSLGFSLSPDGLERAVRENNESAIQIYSESGLIIPTKSLIYVVAEGLEIEHISALVSRGSVKLDQFTEVYQFSLSSNDYSGFGKDSFFEQLRAELKTKEEDFNEKRKSSYRETRIREISARLREIESLDKKQRSSAQPSSDKRRQEIAQKIRSKADSCVKVYPTWPSVFQGSSMKSVPEDCKGLVDAQGMKNEFLINQQIDLAVLESLDNTYDESNSPQDSVREKFDLSLELDYLRSNPQLVTYPQSLRQELTANLTVMSVVEQQGRLNLLQKLKELGIKPKPICSIETNSGTCLNNKS